MITQTSVKELSFVSDELERPECVIALKSGDLFVSDRTGVVAWLNPRRNFERTPLVENGPGSANDPNGFGPADFLCNGFSMLASGDFLVANLGEAGGVWMLDRDGGLQPWMRELDGQNLPPCNYVGVDGGHSADDACAWISVSTRAVPRERSFSRDVADGFIVRVDKRGSRIAADGLGFTNENHVDPSGQWLYVNETIARRMSRFRIHDDASLGSRETVIEFSDGIFPDGFEFDEKGGIWIASVVSNRLVRLDPDGTLQTIVDDASPVAVALAEEHYANNVFVRSDIDAGRHGVLGNLASVNFGGPDLKTVYLGSLFNSHLAQFRSPIAGHTPAHYGYSWR